MKAATSPFLDDFARLRVYGVRLQTRLELQQLALAHDVQQDGTSLAAFSRRYLGLNLDKFGQHADYSSHNLPDKLWEYGALDGRISRRLAEKLLDLVKSKLSIGSVVEAPDYNSMTEGTEVKVKIGGKYAAKATIVFVGVNGMQKTFGDNKFTVGKHKAIVRLVEVFEPTAKVPLPKAKSAWSKKTTIDSVFSSDSRDIVVLTSNLSMPVSTDGPTTGATVHGTSNAESSAEVATMANGTTEHVRAVTASTTDGAIAACPSVTATVTMGDASVSPPDISADIDLLEMMDDNSDYMDFLEMDDCEIGVTDPGNPAAYTVSRMHEDLFHRIKSLPIPKSSPVRTAVLRLLIHACTHFVEEDYNRLVQVLMEKKGVQEDALLDHFYYNKEYWRKRVRMPTFQHNVHANNIQVVHNFVKKALQDSYTDDLRKYFESFESDCLHGKYAELHDVALYRQVGIDADGLDLWIRLKGSVRCENIHRTMRTAMGSHAMGAEVAHYLLILICHRYNVNLGVRRKARPDFGHIHLPVIDALQIVVQEIYNVLIYPAHYNFSLYEATDDVAVGIRPLTAFSDFVQQGEPLETLTPDQKFMAEEMKVKCPPLPPSGRKEMKILNEYYIKHPNATNQDFEALAVEFLRKADGVDIFPKIPAMLKADFGRWNKTSQIKVAVRALDDHGYTELLKNLSSRRTSDDSLLHFNEMHINDSSDDFMLQLDEDPLEAQQYVPPLAAPFQQEHIRIEAPPSASTAGKMRRCAWYPCCNKRVWECGGSRQKSCRRAISGEFEIPSDEEFKRRRKAALSASKAERRQGQRDAQSNS
jgi:hypothetical protein